MEKTFVEPLDDKSVDKVASIKIPDETINQEIKVIESPKSIKHIQPGNKCKNQAILWFFLTILFSITLVILDLFVESGDYKHYYGMFCPHFVVFVCLSSSIFISNVFFTFIIKLSGEKIEKLIIFLILSHYYLVPYGCGILISNVIVEFIVSRYQTFYQNTIIFVNLVHYPYIYYFIVKIIIYMISYRVTTYNFKNLIELHKRKRELVDELNEVMNGHSEKSAEDIFNFLARTKGYISMADIKEVIVKNRDFFIEIFDLNEDDKISKEEFVDTYNDIIDEGDTISEKLQVSNHCVRKFGYMLYVLFSPIVIIPIAHVLGFQKIIPDTVGAKIELLLALNFIFGSFLVELFQDTFFVLFVRPFEVGDIVVVLRREMKVIDIGLLYSTFESDSILISVSNTSIRNEVIENLRTLTSKTEFYDFRVNFEVFKKEENAIRNNITEFLSHRKRIYKPYFEFCNHMVTNDGMLMMKVKIVIKQNYTNKEGLESARANFLFYLTQLQMEYLEHGKNTDQTVGV